MTSVTIQAPAKVNLTLDVVGRRPDGYHMLESIMQSVSCYDTLTARKTSGGVHLLVEGASPCPVEKNTAFRAAQLFFQHTGETGGVEMLLHKEIPKQAGMGGGSADAAAALLALNRLYDTRLTREQLCALGVQIGADVPFCVAGGAAFATGVGERLQELPPLTQPVFVIAQPSQAVSTAEAYRLLDTADITRRPDHRSALEAWRQEDWERLFPQMINVFEEALALPPVAAIRREMEAFCPFASQMTGSGSAVFAVFGSMDQAEACAAALAEHWPVAFVCRPCSGAVFLEESV